MSVNNKYAKSNVNFEKTKILEKSRKSKSKGFKKAFLESCQDPVA